VTRLPVDSAPPVGFVPLHAPAAVQFVAFVLLQVSVADVPPVTVVALASRFTVGAAGAGAPVCDVSPRGLAHPALTMPAMQSVRRWRAATIAGLRCDSLETAGARLNAACERDKQCE
jgi:hypothetical protein